MFLFVHLNELSTKFLTEYIIFELQNIEKIALKCIKYKVINSYEHSVSDCITRRKGNLYCAIMELMKKNKMTLAVTVKQAQLSTCRSTAEILDLRSYGLIASHNDLNVFLLHLL